MKLLFVNSTPFAGGQMRPYSAPHGPHGSMLEGSSETGDMPWENAS